MKLFASKELRVKLEKHWWHRLIKTLFIVFSIIMIPLSFIYFIWEFSELTNKKTIITFEDYQKNILEQYKVEPQEIRQKWADEKYKYNGGYIPLSTRYENLSGFAKYLEDKFNALDKDLGCLKPNGEIITNTLSSYLFTNMDCNYDQCLEKDNWCSKYSGKIVIYENLPKYSVGPTIFFSTLLVTLAYSIFFLLGLTIYHKGILYIIFGRNIEN